jgi:hypothetical protein
VQKGKAWCWQIGAATESLVQDTVWTIRWYTWYNESWLLTVQGGPSTPSSVATSDSWNYPILIRTQAEAPSQSSTTPSNFFCSTGPAPPYSQLYFLAQSLNQPQNTMPRLHPVGILVNLRLRGDLWVNPTGEPQAEQWGPEIGELLQYWWSPGVIHSPPQQERNTDLCIYYFVNFLFLVYSTLLFLIFYYFAIPESITFLCKN